MGRLIQGQANVPLDLKNNYLSQRRVLCRDACSANWDSCRPSMFFEVVKQSGVNHYRSASKKGQKVEGTHATKNSDHSEECGPDVPKADAICSLR